MSEETDPQTSAAEIVPAPNPRNRFTVAADTVATATRTLADFECQQLRWLAKYGQAINASVSELAARLRKPDGAAYSGDSVYQALTGKRSAEGANLEPMAKAIAQLRREVQEVEAHSATTFIETPLSRRLFAIFRGALQKHRLGFVLGESQIGKTTAGNEFARLNNHGTTHLFRVPTGGSITVTVSEMARRLGIPDRICYPDLRRRILDSFDEHNLLIVDEAHQCLYNTKSNSSLMVLEFVREIYDRRKCGVVLMGTGELKDALRHNAILQQLWRRRSPGLVLQLPAEVPVADLNAFADAFRLEPAPDREIRISYEVDGKQKTFAHNPALLQKQLVHAHGLGPWIRLLEDARDLAKETCTRMSWGRVIAAYCNAQAMEEGL